MPDNLRSFLSSDTLEGTKEKYYDVIDTELNDLIQSISKIGIKIDISSEDQEAALFRIFRIFLTVLTMGARANSLREFEDTGLLQKLMSAIGPSVGDRPSPFQRTFNKVLDKSWREVTSVQTVHPDPMRVETKTTRKLVVSGFDPRAASITPPGSFYKRWAPPEAEPGDAAADWGFNFDQLVADYASAVGRIERQFARGETSDDIFVLDLALIPEFASRGSLQPMDAVVHIFGTITDQIAHHAQDEQTRRGLSKLISVLSNYNGRTYALPICLTSQAMFLPNHRNIHFTEMEREISKLFKVKEFEDIVNFLNDDGPYKHSTIQGKPTSSLVFEFFAHLAYCKHVPITVIEQQRSNFAIKVDFLGEAARYAFANFFSLLCWHQASYKQNADEDVFKIGHLEEASILNSSFDSCDVIFPTELANLCRGVVLTDERNILPAPRVLLSTSRFSGGVLTSFGGYGLVIPITCANPVQAVIGARRLFLSAAVESRNIFHPTLLQNIASIIGSGREPDVEALINLHVRPRLPFWIELEQLIAFSIVDIESAIRNDILPKRTSAKEIYRALIDIFVVNPKSEVLRILQNLEERMKLVAENHGWQVTISQRGSKGVKL